MRQRSSRPARRLFRPAGGVVAARPGPRVVRAGGVRLVGMPPPVSKSAERGDRATAAPGDRLGAEQHRFPHARGLAVV
ncbi:MAG: hypothetical protein IRY85_01725 [Micromonosporaceae bacterium]|nr:hypothetical protein [Micromonosporaceae bacterium]